jgi:hypothetical protein
VREATAAWRRVDRKRSWMKFNSYQRAPSSASLCPRCRSAGASDLLKVLGWLTQTPSPSTSGSLPEPNLLLPTPYPHSTYLCSHVDSQPQFSQLFLPSLPSLPQGPLVIWALLVDEVLRGRYDSSHRKPSEKFINVLPVLRTRVCSELPA